MSTVHIQKPDDGKRSTESSRQVNEKNYPENNLKNVFTNFSSWQSTFQGLLALFCLGLK